MNEGQASAVASPIRLANLNTFNPKTSLHFADTYVFRGSSPVQRPFGELFVVVQIDHATRTSPQVTDAIATIVQHEYYRGNPAESAKNFEDALHKTNEILSDLAARGEIHWIGKLHGVIAVVQRETIHVSATGRGRAYLARGNDIADIADGLYDAARPASPMKTFEHLASGELKDDDVVLLCTPGISEAITPQHLRHLLRNNPPERAATEIQSRTGRDPAAAHSGIVLKFDRHAQPALQPVPVRPAREPLEAIGANAVAPAKKSTANASNRFSRQLAKVKQSGATVFLHVINRVKNRLQKKSKTPQAKTKPTPTQKEEATSGTEKKRSTKFLTAVKTAWGRLPKRARLFTIGAMVLVFIFAVSIVAFTNARQGSASREQVATSLKQAKDLEQQVAAAVIFKDFTQAQTLLSQAETILNGIPVDDTTRSEVEALRTALVADKEKLTGSVNVNAPNTLATFEGKGQPRGLTLVGNKLMVWTADGSVALVPTGGGETEAQESIERTLGEPAAGTTDEGRVLVLTGRQNLLSLEDGSVDELVVAGEFEPSIGAALATYGNRLYVLDPEKKKMQRHNRTVAGYTRGEDWIQDETSVAGSVDLAVDGDLWLLAGSGEVVRMRQGSRQDFTLGQPTEPITAATKIVTAEGDTFLYVLEPSKKRLLQFEKESGDFVKQYTSDSFDQLTDVVVNEKGRAAYLLNGVGLIKIDLQS